MAAHFGHARIPQKNTAFLHDLETCHELESCIVMPSYFTTTEWQDKLTFLWERGKWRHIVAMYMKTQSLEINSWGLDIDIGSIYNCVIKFVIGISDQTINYVITRNPRNWPVYSATAMLQLKLRDMVIIMEIELIEVILKWAIMLLLYGESGNRLFPHYWYFKIYVPH